MSIVGEQPQPQPPPPAATGNQPDSRKRPLDSSSSAAPDDNVPRIRTSNSYFKMRSLLNDLRPHFIEVLRTPDYRNCEAAQEIREKLKLLMEHYMLMVEEPANPNKFPQQEASGQSPANTSEAA